MKTLAKPLLKLTAADLMSDPVVMVPEEMSLRKAAHLLILNHISGAPVVDPFGMCIGVLSATDFIRWADDGPSVALMRQPSTETFTPSWMIEPERVPEYPVRKYMTTDPVTVDPDKSIVELSRMMLDAHIHRVIVVNEASQPIGVVSATDILAAVAYAGK
jgi:CBS domain-containing protein